MMKKKIALIFLIAILLVALAGCKGTDGKSRSIEEIQEKYNDLLQKYTSLQEDYDELASDYDSLLSDYATHMADDKISDIISEAENKQPTLEAKNVECYSDDYVTINYSHCETSYGNEKNVVLVVENKTSVSLTIGMNSFSVDGWNLSDAFCFQEISAKSKGYVKISTEELSTLSPKTISGALYVADESKTLFGSLLYDVEFSDIAIE